MSEDQIEIEINGKLLKARKGAMIIQVADEAGMLIPRFCYHKKLSVAANCRMCLVDVEKAPKPLPACATPVMDGMVVRTKSALAIQAQKSVMEFLLINHPLDCPICDQGGECELQDVAMGYGRDLSRFNESKRVVDDKNLGPLIATDMTRCIHCTRCVRFGEEIGGLPELGVTGRGENVKITTFIERNVESELSGNVIDVCPVGALTSKPFRFRARAWEIKQSNTIAPHDAVGSNLYVHVKNGKVVRVVPRENDEVNEVWLSDRDRFSYEGLYSDDRLTKPMVKQGGDWVEVDWSHAIEVAADGLKLAVGAHGAEELGALVSPSSTTEEAFLLQKLVRVLGSNNIDYRLRQNDFRRNAADINVPNLGTSFSSLESNNVTLLVGSDCRREQPMVNHRLRKSVLGGGKVCVVNCIDYDFNYDVETAIVVSPIGMVHCLAEIARYVGLPIKDSNIAGTAFPDSKRVAENLKEAKQCSIVLGSTALASPYASDLKALARGIASKVSATFGLLTDGCNAAGVALAGALPHHSDNSNVFSSRGLNVREMLARPLKAWILCGLEPSLDLGNGGLASRSLSQADFVLSLTTHATDDLKKHADVLLPCSAFAENEGTNINAQGDHQKFVGTVPVLGDSRPGWKILRVLGNAVVSEGFDYLSCSEVMADINLLIETSGDYNLPDTLPRLADDTLWRIGDVPIYDVDMLVRRARSLQQTSLAGTLGAFVNGATLNRLGLDKQQKVIVNQNGIKVSMRLRRNERVADNCVWIAGGVEQSSELGPNYGAVELSL